MAKRIRSDPAKVLPGENPDKGPFINGNNRTMPNAIPTLPARRKVLTGAAALLTGAIALRPAAAQTTTVPAKENAATSAPEYAVFTEFSPASKLAQRGWNTRVFTDTDARKGNSIVCDFTTGIITLAPGLYHISGLSIAAYYNTGEPPETTTIRAPASAGYCRLRTFDPNFVPDPNSRGIENSDPSVISIGSPASANLTPSLVEAYFEAGKTTQILLEHQSGSNPAQIYLRVFSENSKWHVFARLSIRRI
jgi:hypothetical protein